jgi:hypothetical protein
MALDTEGRKQNEAVKIRAELENTQTFLQRGGAISQRRWENAMGRFRLKEAPGNVSAGGGGGCLRRAQGVFNGRGWARVGEK